MAGNDDRTTHASMSQIYAHIYDSRTCNMLSRIANDIIPMSYDWCTCGNIVIVLSCETENSHCPRATTELLKKETPSYLT